MGIIFLYNLIFLAPRKSAVHSGYQNAHRCCPVLNRLSFAHQSARLGTKETAELEKRRYSRYCSASSRIIRKTKCSICCWAPRIRRSRNCQKFMLNISQSKVCSSIAKGCHGLLTRIRSTEVKLNNLYEPPHLLAGTAPGKTNHISDFSSRLSKMPSFIPPPPALQILNALPPSPFQHSAMSTQTNSLPNHLTHRHTLFSFFRSTVTVLNMSHGSDEPTRCSQMAATVLYSNPD